MYSIVLCVDLFAAVTLIYRPSLLCTGERMTCKRDTPIAALNALRAALCLREILTEGAYAAFAKRANVLFGFQDLNNQKFLRQGTIALHRGAEVEVHSLRQN